LFWVFNEFDEKKGKRGLGLVDRKEREGKPLVGSGDLGDSNWVCIQRLRRVRYRKRGKKVRE